MVSDLMRLEKLQFVKTLGEGGYGQVCEVVCVKGSLKGKFFALKRQPKKEDGDDLRIKREKKVSR